MTRGLGAARTRLRDGAPAAFAVPDLTSRTFAISLLVIGLASCATSPEAVSEATDRWEEDIRAFESTDRANPPPQDAVLFVGSSSIRLWDTLEEDLEGIPIIKRGFGGSEMVDAVRYANRIVLPYRPRMVIVYAGDNDLWSAKTPQRVLNDFRSFVRRIHSELPETRIAFIAVKPSVARWSIAGHIREANGLVERYAATDPRVDYLDIFTPMLGRDGAPRPDLFVEDGLHLNARGYDIWESVVEPYVRRGIDA